MWSAYAIGDCRRELGENERLICLDSLRNEKKKLRLSRIFTVNRRGTSASDRPISSVRVGVCDATVT